MRKLFGIAALAALAVAWAGPPVAAGDNDGRLRRPGSDGSEASARAFFAAEVAADGTLVSGAGAISSARINVGAYQVIFNKNNLHVRCWWTVSPGGRGIFQVGLASASAEARSGTNNGIFVVTRDPNGVAVDNAFMAVAVCR